MSTGPILLVVVASVFAAYGGLYMKLGAEDRKKPKEGYTPRAMGRRYRQLAVGVFFYVTSAAFYLAGLRGGDLSLLFPISSMSYVWVAFLSTRRLDEKMTPAKWAAIACILFGVTLIGVGSA